MDSFFEMSAVQNEQCEINPFIHSTDENEKPAIKTNNEGVRQQAVKNITEAEEIGTEPLKESSDKKKAEHEVAEEKRKVEWEAQQKLKKEADQKALAEIAAMTDDEVMSASIERTRADIERLTRRNMKICVTDHLQTLCMKNPEFARNVMFPKKSMINCFKYINIKAQEYLKQEMEMNGEKPENGGFGGDVPDDLCYQWAEEYYKDLNAEVDKSKDEKFVPKPYSGGSSASKSVKKETKKPVAIPVPSAHSVEQMQLTLGA